MRIIVAALLFSLPAFAETHIQLNRTCPVQAQPHPAAQAVCGARAGTSVDSVEGAGDHYFRVKIGFCEGYLSRSCVVMPGAAPAKAAALRREPSPAAVANTVGIVGVFDFSRAVVPYDSGWSKGFSLAGGLQFHFPFDGLRLSPAVSYQRLALTHDMDGSGALDNESPTPVTLTGGYLGAEVLFGMELEGAVYPGDPVLWGEAGFEYLHPLSASQTIGNGAPQSFTNTDKLLLAKLGISWDHPLSKEWILGGRLALFYNLAGTAGSRYFGGRLSIAVSTTL